MSAAEDLSDLLDDLITLEVFCEQTKITKKAAYAKIYKAVWTEGQEYFRDPQNRIWVSRTGYQQWIRSGLKPTQQALNQEKKQFKSSSGSRVKLTTVTKHCTGTPPQLT